jgi:non-ribosomal peptide synthetase component F
MTQSTDVLFGYMTANRDLPIAGIDELVGPMINMLACRLAVAPSTPITTLLEQTHASFLETLDHQHAFVAAAAAKSAGTDLPFNSVLSIEYADEGDSYYPTAAPGQSSLDFETVGGTRAPEFDVVLGVLLGSESVDVQLGYWDGVVEREVAENVAAMYAAVVEEMVGAQLGGMIGDVEALA